MSQSLTDGRLTFANTHENKQSCSYTTVSRLTYAGVKQQDNKREFKAVTLLPADSSTLIKDAFPTTNFLKIQRQHQELLHNFARILSPAIMATNGDFSDDESQPGSPVHEEVQNGEQDEVEDVPDQPKSA